MVATQFLLWPLLLSILHQPFNLLHHLVSPLLHTVFCQGSTNSLTDATGGGAWTTDNAAVATVSAGGVVTGQSAGSAVITYTVTDGNGCKNSVTTSITVAQSPTVTATANPTAICAGQNAQISAASPGNIPTTVCATNTATGNQGNFADGDGDLSRTVTITGVPAGVTITGITLTVNATHQRDNEVEMYLIPPAPIGTPLGGTDGTFQHTTTPNRNIRLFGTPTGTPVNGANFVNTVFSDAGVGPLAGSGGPYTGTFQPANSFASITPTMANSANVNGVWTLVILDHVNSGFTGVFRNYTLCITYSTSGGIYNWTSNPTGFGTGITTPGPFTVTPTVNTDYTVTVTGASGCVSAPSTATVIVNPAPTVTGTLTTCIGSTTTLIGSGTPATTNPWTSATMTVATVSNTGVVTGVAVGTSNITYTDNTGCGKTVTVNVIAKPTITGALNVCPGFDDSPGRFWYPSHNKSVGLSKYNRGNYK